MSQRRTRDRGKEEVYSSVALCHSQIEDTLRRGSTYIGIFQDPGIQHNIIDSISSLQSDYVAYEFLLTVRQLEEEIV